MSTERTREQVGPIDVLGLFPPERWFAECLGYFDSATELFASMTSGRLQPTWPSAKAGAFLFSHGLELFFKAAIAQAGEKFLWGHSLDRFQSIYRSRFPDPEFVLCSNIADFIKQNAPIPFYDFLKYPERVEEINKSWPAALMIDVRDWHGKVSLTASEVRRVWPLIIQRYPLDLSRWQRSANGDFENSPRKKKTASSK